MSPSTSPSRHGGAPTGAAAYTPSQIQSFYTRINLPRSHRHGPGSPFLASMLSSSSATSSATSPSDHLPHPPTAALEFLTVLQRYTLASIPFENLDLHYSVEKKVSVDVDDMFRKVVMETERGRGGYCMQNNKMFGAVLRGLGFEVKASGARVKSEASNQYSGWSHMINIVTLSPSHRYVVDVGFGGGCQTKPMLLAHDKPHLNIGPSQMLRLEYISPASAMGWSSTPSSTAETQDEHQQQQHNNRDGDEKLWVLERQNHPGEPWTPIYMFPDNVTFTDQDFEVMNFWTSESPKSWFTKSVVVVKYVLGRDTTTTTKDEEQKDGSESSSGSGSSGGGSGDKDGHHRALANGNGREENEEEGEEEEPKIIGELILLDNKFKRRIGDETQLPVGTVIETEAQRIQILREWFGIALSEEQEQGIKGSESELGE